MWPWEHAALGYLLISVATRLVWARPPDDAAALLAVFGSQVPDLVDKPLGWVFEVLPSGVSLGHSLFVATAVCLCVWVAGVARDRRPAALAFCLGYLSHLPADILYPVLSGGRPHWWVTLWPFVVRNARGDTPAVAYASALFADFLAALTGSGGEVSTLLVVEVVLVVGTLAVWLRDGHPGLPPYRRTPEPS